MRVRLLGTFAAALCLGVSLQSGFAADYLGSAQSALHKGDLRTAQIELRNAVRSDPQNAEARFLLAEVQLQLGDPVAAEQQARAAQERGYDKVKTIPLIGEALLQQNRARDLLNEFKTSGNNPKLDAEILVDRGTAELALGHLDQARQDYEEAQHVDPSSLPAWLAGARLALARGDITAARAQVEHALAINSKSLDARLLQAQLLVRAKDIGGAINLLNTAVNETPPALPARLLRANLLIAQGKLAEAKTDDDAVLAVQPANVEALYLKAVLLHAANDDQGANEILTHLQPVFDRLPRAYFLQALVRERLGQTQLAADSARAYVARVPDDPAGVMLLAQLEIQAGRPDEAMAPLQALVADGHADVKALELLARVAMQTGQPQVARDALLKAIAATPDDARLKAQLGGVLVQLGQPDAGLQQLEAALAKDPKQPQIGEALFLAALKTGNLDRAAAELSKIRQAQGDTVVVRNLDGALKMARFDLPGATAEFEAIVKSDPDFLPAQINLARALASQGDMAGYQKVLEGILAKNPDSEPALGMLTDSLLRNGHADQAIALLEKAHAAAKDNGPITLTLGDLYIRTGAPQKALDLIAPTTPGGAVATPYLGLQASAELALKQTDKARATLSRILELQPRNVVARRQLVALLLDVKDYEGARNLLRAGMAAVPDAYQFKLDYALVDLKEKGIDAAEATAADLYNQDRGNSSAAALKGDVFLAAGKAADAVKAYEAALKTSPSQLLMLRLANAQQQLGQTNDAEHTLSNWTAAHPDDLTALQALASLELVQGQYAAAKTHLQAVLAKQPFNGAALNNLAWVEQKLGDPGAKQLAQQAYLLDPTPQTADTFGWILTTSGDPSKGRILLQQASDGSNDPRIFYHLAVALKDTGDREQALKLLQKVADAQGQFEEKSAAQRMITELNKGS